MLKEHSAGGVVFRKTTRGIEVLMIIDRFGRLTLPKGKLEAGEGSREAGLREIREETGILGNILAELMTAKYVYTDPIKGEIDKQVDYYLVQASSEDITPQIEEISEAKWLSLEAAIELCGYENNLPVLNKTKDMLQSFTH